MQQIIFTGLAGLCFALSLTLKLDPSSLPKMQTVPQRLIVASPDPRISSSYSTFLLISLSKLSQLRINVMNLN